MRYKRVNTLALDVSAMPSCPDNATIRKVLDYLQLDPARMKSVQIHSSHKTIYLGLPDDQSASAIAAKHPRGIGIKGSGYYMRVAFVDEDAVEVRVRDVPPDTPNKVIEDSLRRYGDVLSVTSEVWKDFFPGALTGVRVVRMKINSSIPATVPVGNHVARIKYTGQIDV